MEALLTRAVEAYVEPYDDRDERESSLSSLRTVADQLNTTILRTRKLLITAEYYSTETSRLVQSLTNAGMGIEEIMAATSLKRASINSYLPYKNLAFNLDQTTVNADRHRMLRRRVKAVEELRRHVDLPDELEYLWKAIIAFHNYPFKTSGRGSRKRVRTPYCRHARLSLVAVASDGGVREDTNVSDKVVRIIQSFVGVVNKMVWRKE